MDRKKVKIVIVSGIVAVVLVIALLTVLFVRDSSTDKGNVSVEDMIKAENMLVHLKSLEDIAYKNGGSRTAISGYNDSVAYVIEQLKATNYIVTTQEFQFSYFQELTNPEFATEAPLAAKYLPNVDFRNIRYGGSGTASGILIPVGGGCTESQYANFTAGAIPLVDRGQLTDCNMTTKIQNAIAHNAVGVVLYNDADKVGLFSAGLTVGTSLPAFAITYDLGMKLLEALKTSNISATMAANNTNVLVGTMNIIADTKDGNPDSTIVVGSHLDSVPAGPGINDNGSGSAANLQLAIQFAKSKITLANRIRFAWWAAEEFGLLGSTHYVNDLVKNNDAALKQIALNLNFDMLGSPNFERGIYNGSSSTSERVRPGSAVIQGLFERHFQNRSISYKRVPFNGRSDYGPFIAAGVDIPAGGLFSGAEEIKTMEDRKMFGGWANAGYDPCYHAYCDTVDNIDKGALEDMTKAAADVLQTLATTSELRHFLDGGVVNSSSKSSPLVFLVPLLSAFVYLFNF